VHGSGLLPILVLLILIGKENDHGYSERGVIVNKTNSKEGRCSYVQHEQNKILAVNDYSTYGVGDSEARWMVDGVAVSDEDDGEDVRDGGEYGVGVNDAMTRWMTPLTAPYKDKEPRQAE
jgi:hypothetical protein